MDPENSNQRRAHNWLYRVILSEILTTNQIKSLATVENEDQFKFKWFESMKSRSMTQARSDSPSDAYRQYKTALCEQTENLRRRMTN